MSDKIVATISKVWMAKSGFPTIPSSAGYFHLYFTDESIIIAKYMHMAGSPFTGISMAELTLRSSYRTAKGKNRIETSFKTKKDIYSKMKNVSEFHIDIIKEIRLKKHLTDGVMEIELYGKEGILKKNIVRRIEFYPKEYKKVKYFLLKYFPDKLKIMDK